LAFWYAASSRFALEGVFGTVDREALLVQQAANLGRAEFGAGDLGQVGRQSPRRPRRKTVAQRARVGGGGVRQCLAEFSGGGRRAAGRLVGVQCRRSTRAIALADPLDCLDTAAEVVGDPGDGAATVGEQKDGAVAEDIGGTCGTAQFVQFIELGVREPNPSDHG
jgi:hypothetical protein